MDHSTLCARALLDSAIHNCDSRFFVEQFGRNIEQYNFTDYHKLLNDLTDRLQQKIVTRDVLFEDVPPSIRELFTHGATLNNVQYFYALPTRILRTYQHACKCYKKSFPSKPIPRSLLKYLASLSRNVDQLTADMLVELSIDHQITVPLLLREIVGEL
ncbi:hypothetical protein [Vibrio sp. R78045]|uniref:hypothetical protein n=1 Tax=Vibrio sp. R78045 TaxID=3093868 RepID=UPI0036F289E9